jgi:hypothetical protein
MSDKISRRDFIKMLGGVSFFLSLAGSLRHLPISFHAQAQTQTPTIDYALKNGYYNIVGSRVRLRGSGFVPGMSVLANGEQMPDVHVIDSNNSEFTLLRPSVGVNTTVYGGDSVSIQVRLPDGRTSERAIIMMLNTFVLAVFGDSIAWGQGLREEEKYHALVAKDIANRLSTNNVNVFDRNVKAHSGAIIGVCKIPSGPIPFGDVLLPDACKRPRSPLPGEVPTSWPTVLRQVDEFEGPPEAVNLVLVDGGINDVGVSYILDPSNSVEAIQNNTRVACYDDMKTLLQHIIHKFPNPETKVIVSGYYQIISEDTDLVLLAAILTLAFGINGLIAAAPLRSKLASNSLAFANTANSSLQKAVNEVNAQLGGRTRVSLAVPPFNSTHAVMASSPWLFGISRSLQPQDSVAADRANQCDSAGSRVSSKLRCSYASVGHPNQVGAQEYASSIIPFLSDIQPRNTVNLTLIPNPSTLEAGTSTQIIVRAEDSSNPSIVLSGTVFIDNDTNEFKTNESFNYIFHAGSHNVRAIVAGYPQASFTFYIKPRTLNVRVDPFPVTTNKLMQVTVYATDSETRKEVDGRVKIYAIEAPGDPPQPPDGFPTNKPFTYIFRPHIAGGRPPRIPPLDGRVIAPDYISVRVMFTPGPPPPNL